MSSNALASSFLIFSYTWFSKLSLCTSQLSSFQLPYRSIPQPQNQLNNNLIREISFSDLLDALLANFLAALRDNIKEFESESGNKNI